MKQHSSHKKSSSSSYIVANFDKGEIHPRTYQSLYGSSVKTYEMYANTVKYNVKTLLQEIFPTHHKGRSFYFYHGTTPENADSILKTGFDRKKMGTGIAGHVGLCVTPFEDMASNYGDVIIELKLTPSKAEMLSSYPNIYWSRDCYIFIFKSTEAINSLEINSVLIKHGDSYIIYEPKS